MRIAFVACPALGHVLPLLPLAIAARDAGHDVVVLAGSSCSKAIDAAGLRHATSPSPDLQTVFARLPGRAGLKGPRLVAATWRHAFAGVLAQELAMSVMDLAGSWRPDLVVHEDADLGSWVAAERLGIPAVTLQATAWRTTTQRLSREPLGRLRAAYGLPPDPELRRWHMGGYLTTRPPSLHNPSDPMPASTRPIRPIAADEVVARAPDWIDAVSVPRVCVTMGTMPLATEAVLPWIAAAFDGFEVEVVLTTGPTTDPALLGSPPPNVRVVPYVPMSRLLPTCAALVFHAGSGTMLASLAAGVPMVLVPIAADQPANADRCEAAGVGIAVRGRAQAPAGVRKAVEAVLTDGRYREAAVRVRDEVEAMPAPEAVVPDLERLVAGWTRPG